MSSQTPRPELSGLRVRSSGARRSRGGGWALALLGLLVALPAGVLLAVVLHVVPLDAVLPANMRATGPVRATAPAVVSIAAVLLAGLLALTQGVHQIARGGRSLRLFAVVLGLGAALLGALALASCGSPGSANAAEPGAPSLARLAGAEWTLVEIDGEPLPAGAKPPTASFEAGRVAGFGGCNRYSGPIEEESPGKIEIGTIASTMMACIPEAQVESRFLAHLGKATRYTLVAGDLVLSGPDEGATPSLLFRRR